jgi:hypothetical protein
MSCGQATTWTLWRTENCEDGNYICAIAISLPLAAQHDVALERGQEDAALVAEGLVEAALGDLHRSRQLAEEA